MLMMLIMLIVSVAAESRCTPQCRALHFISIIGIIGIAMTGRAAS